MVAKIIKTVSRSRKPQLELLQNQPKAYGGELLKKRKNRLSGRPLDTKNSMHLVLRSSRATGKWSFREQKNEDKVKEIVARFSRKFGVQVLRMGNAGNHLHMQIKLGNRFTYRPFIRALTSAIAMAVTGASRWNPLKGGRFWDYRPFTRVVIGFKALLSLQDYIDMNTLEGHGCDRQLAKLFILDRKNWVGKGNTS